VFRTAVDAELTRKIYERVPVLVNARIGENPWGIRFLRMFDMSNDSNLFYSEPGPGRVPLYEGKMVGMYDHRASSVVFREENRIRQNHSQATTETQHAGPNFTVSPLWWVNKDEVSARLPGHRWFVGLKDITSSTNERTLIASILPFSGVGHTISLITVNESHKQLLACLLANLNCLVVDYVARQKVGGMHLSFSIIEQLPILPPEVYEGQSLQFISSRAVELTYTSWDVVAFAEEMGFAGPPVVWNATRREYLRAELDAYFAHLYGFTRDELRYILDPQDVMGPDFPGETFRVLKDNEMREFGEYRTRRLVLEAYDALTRDFRDRPVASSAG
jgi:hypothetical protein